jgi:hypothetical protein
MTGTALAHHHTTVDAHALGVLADAAPIGIFDDWHRWEVESLTAEIMIERARRRRGDEARQRWVLVAALGWGMFLIAAVTR